MLKKLNEKKRKRERTRASRGTVLICFVAYFFKHIDVNPDGSASFELDLNLLDASSRIFIYKVN